MQIQTDFSNFFNKPIDIFNTTWTQIAPKIIAIAKTKKKDADIKDTLSTNKIIQNEGEYILDTVY